MKAFRNSLAAAITLAIAVGCSSVPVPSAFRSKGEPEFTAGIHFYEDGKYGESAKLLQSALDAGLNNSEQVKAHKYLAFVYCATAREKLCRDEFRKALDINPALELEPAEAGHPIWGPVFSSVKARR
jgi:Tfp pilus assembly protein PilF